MSINLLPALSARVANAFQILETIVIRTNEGAVFTISIGKSMLADTGKHSIGARVSLQTTPETHLGICEGETVEKVSLAAQELISAYLASNNPSVSRSATPKPHISLETKASA